MAIWWKLAQTHRQLIDNLMSSASSYHLEDLKAEVFTLGHIWESLGSFNILKLGPTPRILI